MNHLPEDVLAIHIWPKVSWLAIRLNKTYNQSYSQYMLQDLSADPKYYINYLYGAIYSCNETLVTQLLQYADFNNGLMLILACTFSSASIVKLIRTKIDFGQIDSRVLGTFFTAYFGNYIDSRLESITSKLYYKYNQQESNENENMIDCLKLAAENKNYDVLKYMSRRAEYDAGILRWMSDDPKIFELMYKKPGTNEALVLLDQTKLITLSNNKKLVTPNLLKKWFRQCDIYKVLPTIAYLLDYHQNEMILSAKYLVKRLYKLDEYELFEQLTQVSYYNEMLLAHKYRSHNCTINQLSILNMLLSNRDFYDYEVIHRVNIPTSSKDLIFVAKQNSFTALLQLL